MKSENALSKPICCGQEGRPLPKKKADHSRMLGSRLNKQGDLLMRLVLGEMNSFGTYLSES